MQHPHNKTAILFTMLIFFSQPVLFGTWLSQVAQIQALLNVDKAQLSFALIGLPAGLLPTLYFASKFVEKRGPRKAMLWVFPPLLIFGALPGYVPGIPALFVTLFLFGVFIAIAELAMNVYAGRAEQQSGRLIMNRAHGFWSAGVMVGSLIGVQLVTNGISSRISLLLVAGVMMPVLVYLSWSAPHIPKDMDDGPKNHGSTDINPIPKALILIAVAVFGATLIEGTMNDWATVYMVEIVKISQGQEGYAVAIFAGFVTLGRFLGDGLNAKIGPVNLARFCIGSALLGLLILIFSSDRSLAYLGFALAGFGVSTIFPLGVSACAAIDKANVERNVAIMTFGALLGFLVAPPLIGFVSESANLAVGFSLLLPGAIASIFLARYLRS
ncbi:MAG: MFS transporter [Paracoccaceae bacterium]